MLRVLVENILFSTSFLHEFPFRYKSPTGQPYVLATLPAFAAISYESLQGKSAQVYHQSAAESADEGESNSCGAGLGRSWRRVMRAVRGLRQG